MSIQVEICCGGYTDGLAAWRAGAGRIELNTALSLGGLSASLAALCALKQETSLEIVTMVRVRAGGFCYSKEETEIMFDEARLFLEHGADGIAFGFLKEDRTVDREKTKRMTELIHRYHKTAVFHRAVDITPDIEQAIRDLILCGVDRVLTSGHETNAYAGIETIKVLQEHYGNKICILAGCGIHSKNAKEILQKTGVRELHSSCKGTICDIAYKSGDLSFAENEKNELQITDEEEVKRLIQATE